MREITVSAWDDIHLTEEGQRVPADPASAAVLTLDGKTAELDLTTEHRMELEADLARWFKAAREPAGSMASPRQKHPIHSEGLTPLQAVRRYNAAMREWAERVDPRGEKYKITMGRRNAAGGSKPYYPQDLRDDYAAHLAAQAGSAEG